MPNPGFLFGTGRKLLGDPYLTVADIVNETAHPAGTQLVVGEVRKRPREGGRRDRGHAMGDKTRLRHVRAGEKADGKTRELASTCH